MTSGSAGITSTLYVHRVRSEAIAQNFSAFARNINATPANVIDPNSTPVVMPSSVMAMKTPGYAMRINELPQKESDEMLALLFEHQLKPEYRYRHEWAQGDLLMWENFGTIHNAIADYGPDEHRLIKRCQVMATRFFQAA